MQRGVTNHVLQVCDAFESYIWEPVLVKESALNAATEAACLILSIDETVKNPCLGRAQVPSGCCQYSRHFESPRQSEKPQAGPKGKGKGKAGLRGEGLPAFGGHVP